MGVTTSLLQLLMFLLGFIITLAARCPVTPAAYFLYYIPCMVDPEMARSVLPVQGCSYADGVRIEHEGEFWAAKASWG